MTHTNYLGALVTRRLTMKHQLHFNHQSLRKGCDVGVSIQHGKAKWSYFDGLKSDWALSDEDALKKP